MNWDEYWAERGDGGHRYKSEDFLTDEAREKLFHLDGGSTLLDFGCGAAELLTHYVHHFETVGVDFSGSMLSAARDRLTAKGLTAELIEANDASVWNLLEGRKFDRITCAGVVQYFTTAQLSRFLTEARRHLSGSGLIALFDVIDPRPLFLYERGALQEGGSVPTTPLILRRSVRVAARRTIRRLRGQPPLELGAAFRPELIRSLADDAGLRTVRLVRSMYYDYRYHAILAAA